MLEHILDWFRGLGVILLVIVPLGIVAGMGYIVIHFVIKYW